MSIYVVGGKVFCGECLLALVEYGMEHMPANCYHDGGE